MDDKATKIYEYLKSQNVKNLPATQEDFSSRMQSDENLRGSVYKYLSDRNVKNFPQNQEEFDNFFFQKTQPQEEATTEDSKTPATPSYESGERIDFTEQEVEGTRLDLEQGKFNPIRNVVEKQSYEKVLDSYQQEKETTQSRIDEINSQAEQLGIDAVRLPAFKMPVRGIPESYRESQESIDLYNQEVERLNEQGKQAEELSEEYIKLAKKRYLLELAENQYRQQNDEAVRQGVQSVVSNLPSGIPLIGSVKMTAENMIASYFMNKATSDFEAKDPMDRFIPQVQELSNKISKEVDVNKTENYKKAEEFYKQSAQTQKEWGIVGTLEDIDSPEEFLNFAVSSFGEQLPQFGQAALTFGVGTYVQEKSSIAREIIQDQLEKGKTLEEALGSDEVNSIVNDISAISIAGLDLLGLVSMGAPKMLKPLAKKGIVRGLRYLGEPVTEVAQEQISKSTVGVQTGKGFEGLEPMEIANIAAKSIIPSATVQTISDFSKTGKPSQELLNEASSNPKSLEVLQGIIKTREGAGIISTEEADRQIAELNARVAANLQIPDNIQGEQRKKIVELQKEYNALEEEQKRVPPAFKEMYKQKMDAIQEKIATIASEPVISEEVEISEDELSALEAEIAEQEKEIKESPKKADIERRRQEELFNAPNEMLIAPMIGDGKGGFIDNPELAKAREVKDKINAKYDAKLAALEESQATPLQEEEKTKIAESIGKSRKVKAKNVRGLLDVMGGIFGLNKPQAESAAVVGDVMVETMAKRAGVSKDEMYQKIAYQKAQKAPDGSLKQESPLFKSTAKEGLSKIQQKAATPEQWVKMITDKGGKGTSQELEWLGLQDYLNEWKKENNAKSVPKEVVEQYIEDNQIEIVEVSKGKPVIKIEDLDAQFDGSGFVIRYNGKGNLITPYITLDQIDLTEEDIYEEDFDYYSAQEAAKVVAREEMLDREDGDVKHSDYQLEGGENYREVLFTLPNNRKSDQKFYEKNHFDEGNILAHLRINERTLPNGERVMFIEEVQSDWAQEGKKKGFKEIVRDENLVVEKANDGTFNVKTKDGLLMESGFKTQREAEDFTYSDIGITPDMPYKKTDQWVGMAMRRAMQMAAQEGFDRVAWVTGEQSADRYDLSKQIGVASAIKNDDGTYNLVLEDTRGDELPEYRGSGKKMTPSEMEDTIGKELTQKLIEGADRNKGREWKNEPTNPQFFTLRGDGLKVGGEGMKAFYNSILPKAAKKEAQRFDKKAKVEVVDFTNKSRLEALEKELETVRSNERFDILTEEINRIRNISKSQSKTVGKQLSIPITPEMRMNLNGAVPLFQDTQGAMLAEDGNYIIYALTNPNVSTPLHELAHVYEHYLTDAERKQILNWAGTKEWTTKTSEKFARGFEKYLAEGKAPTPVLQKYFDNFKQWLIEIYNGIVGSEIDIELNEEMRSIYDQMIKEEVTSKQKEQSGAKKPQEKQETAKSVTAEEKTKQEPQEKEEVKKDEKEDSSDKKIRGFAKSTTQAFTGLKESIEKNPENYYTPQEWAKMKDKLSEMTDDEVIERMSDFGLNTVKDGNDNNAVLASIELINRRLAEDKPIDDIVERFSKEGTKMGQLIAQFATLNSSTPFGIMSTINKIAEKQGKILSQKQKKDIQDLAKKMLKSRNKLDNHIKEKGGLATKEDIKEMKRLNKEAEKASREFLKRAAPFTTMSWSDMLQMSVQGNLLTLGSQVTNVASNIGQQAVLTPVNTIGDFADLVASIFTKKRVGSFDPRKYGYAWVGRWEYLKDAFKTIAYGDNTYAKGDVKMSFRPIQAATQMLSETKIGDIIGIEQGLLPKTVTDAQKKKLLEAKKLADDGNIEEAEKIRDEVLNNAKISMNDRLKKLYEASFGTPVEIMFRLLSLGDKPFLGGEIYKQRFEYAKRKGLKGEQLRAFVLMPDAKTQEQINEDAKEVVFQEDGELSKLAEKITSNARQAAKNVPIVGGFLSFIFRLNVPFVKTPSNIISQMIDFAIPPVALAKAAINYKKGNQRKGNKNVGIAITGYAMMAAAEWLVANGLISAAIDWGDEDDKNIKMKVSNPNALNIDGLQRALNGKDPSYKAGDNLIDISKFGIPGAVVLIRANKARNDLRDSRNKAVNIKDEKSDLDGLIGLFNLDLFPETAQFAFEQSFLAGTSALLEALKGGEYEYKRWFKQMLSASSSVALPNTLSQLNRATETYLPDTRVDELADGINVLISNKVGFLYDSKFSDFPIRVDMWGDPIRRTPEGKNPYFYQFFDITRSKEVPDDPLSLEIYQLYKLTQNPRIVPNMPSRVYYEDGNKYEIPKSKKGNEIYNDFAVKVQKLKRKYAEREFKKSSYKRASIEKKIEKMGDALSKYQYSYKYKRFKKDLIKTLKQK